MDDPYDDAYDDVAVDSKEDEEVTELVLELTLMDARALLDAAHHRRPLLLVRHHPVTRLKHRRRRHGHLLFRLGGLFDHLLRRLHLDGIDQIRLFLDDRDFDGRFLALSRRRRLGDSSQRDTRRSEEHRDVHRGGVEHRASDLRSRENVRDHYAHDRERDRGDRLERLVTQNLGPLSVGGGVGKVRHAARHGVEKAPMGVDCTAPLASAFPSPASTS